MGIILTRLRKKKQTTLEVLESLEEKIKYIEEYRLSTEQRHRKIIAHLILYSVGLYVLATLLFYFYFFPASLGDLLISITPLLIFPVIILFLKRLVSWYYHRKISSNQEKLIDMKNKKKQLLDEVMEKETYKVAKQILEKYAPDQLRKTPSTPAKPGLDLVPSVKSSVIPSPSSPLGKPAIIGPVPPGGPLLPTVGGELRHRGPVPAGDGELRNRGPVLKPPALAPTPPQAIQGKPGFVARLPPGPPMPRQILPRERGVVDKLMEYLVGDGPSNRYALICRQCESHNGMALKEEFEYLSFRCCYCYYWNPARKQRPHAPRLMQSSPSHTSASELESDSNTTEDEESEAESGSGSLVIEKEGKELPEASTEVKESVILGPSKKDVDVPLRGEELNENKDLELAAAAVTPITDL
ncbi:endoplasmic reticulum junction formation protein lunapark-A isoform X2 [Anabrus simplex]|uniref:endoplasmic reticulum junction formation protein lunapark-A isoform X2 n=1 Tax=Anabrus simplex TaxID=316456 RepID=UPI0034DD44F2